MNKVKQINAKSANSDEIASGDLAHKLAERVKELNCLYGISRLIESGNKSLEDILHGAVTIIPAAWQYPEITCARINVKKQRFLSHNFKETNWKQSEIIYIKSLPYGRVDVFYTEEKPVCDEGPFLREERDLIHAIAERLGHVIERKIADDQLVTLYNQEKELTEKLQHEIQAKSEFTRRLIHELKTPLTSLIATSQLLHEEIHDKKIEKLAGYVWNNACTMNNRIDELHDMIKGEIGRLELELKPLDLETLIKSVIDETQSLAQQYSIKLDLQMKNPLMPVYADSNRVKQIIMNLLNNIFKYANNSNTIFIKTLTNSINVLIEVQDKGPGIPKEEQKRIFEPYYRSSHKRDQSPGLGIGLALCKVLVEAHGGKIWVKSQPGKGASFFFTLPRLTPDHKRSGQSKQP
jgi:signal transduction histidine kinase